MRGSDERSGALFSYVGLEARVRRDHPLRPILETANAASVGLTTDFEGLYSGLGRPSLPPEKLLRAMLLQAFYGIRSARRIMLEADKAYDAREFVTELRARSITPHRAIEGHRTKTGKRRRTAIDGRTVRHAGYGMSQRCRKRIEEVFGWIKSQAGLAKVKVRGRLRVDAAFALALAACNPIRLPKLLAGLA